MTATGRQCAKFRETQVNVGLFGFWVVVIVFMYCALNWPLNASLSTWLSVAWQANPGECFQMFCVTPPAFQAWPCVDLYPTPLWVWLIHGVGDHPKCFKVKLKKAAMHGCKLEVATLTENTLFKIKFKISAYVGPFWTYSWKIIGENTNPIPK